MISLRFVSRFLRRRTSETNIWDVFARRAEGRSQVELEAEHNRGTQEAIRNLPPGARLRERGPAGTREIWMPDVFPPQAANRIDPPCPAIDQSGFPELEPPSVSSQEADGEPNVDIGQTLVR
jgi:hypothetical protein